MDTRKLAIVTGASSGIGFELARLAAADGYDLLIAADEERIEAAAATLRRMEVSVEAIQADLSTIEGVDRLLAATAARPVDILFANAGRGLGRGFLDQNPADWRRVVDTNITGTLYLIQKVLKSMRLRNDGKLLITGSIAGFIPGSFQAVYNGTKAFLDSFADALRNELKQYDGITITTLMPGPTETLFFERAGMKDTKIGTAEKDDPTRVARDGYDALMSGQSHIVSGIKNKLQAAMAHVTPSALLAEQHRHIAEPGSDGTTSR